MYLNPTLFGLFFCAISCIGHTPPPITTTPRDGSRRPPNRLGNYRVSEDEITLSGFSSGGTFAQQLQISYSSLFSGIAVFSHTFYRCGPGDGNQASFDNVCTTLGKYPNERLYDPRQSSADIQRYFREGLIENPSNLRNKKLYVYTGTNNWLFSTDQSLRILNVYEPLIGNPAAIFTRVQSANLSLPTEHFGNSCPEDSSGNFFIANCGLNGPYEALKFLLGEWIQKSRIPRRQLQPLVAFDQTEFYPRPLIRHDMDSEGFLYIPRSCKEGIMRCHLHFYFHGCLVGREFVGENHIRNSGYLELAETNGIIMVFPQALKSPENDIGCWDTYNVTGSQFATQKGAQVITVKNMLNRILGSRFGDNGNSFQRPDTVFGNGNGNRDPIFASSGASSSFGGSSVSANSGSESSGAGRPSHHTSPFNYDRSKNNWDYQGTGNRRNTNNNGNNGWRRNREDNVSWNSNAFPFFAAIPQLYQQ